MSQQLANQKPLSADKGVEYLEDASVRHDVIALVPEDAEKILEVGCGLGRTGEALKQRGVKTIVGMEVNPIAVETARPLYTDLIAGDVETVEPDYQDGFFDCIVYADILEHLRDPWTLLERHRRLLRDDGVIVCSIPNIRYYKVLRPLALRGAWQYADKGILDKTHLRFFTLQTIRHMMETTGYEIRQIVKRPSGGKFWKLLNRVLFNSLIDFLTVQYLVVAQKRRT